MSIYQILYLLALIISLVLSLVCRKSDSSLRVFPWLLSASLVTELVVHYLRYVLHLKPQHLVAYHVYIPLEYGLLCWYLYQNADSRWLKQSILYSIPVFVVYSVVLSVWITSVYVVPAANFNTEGILIIIWALAVLFTLPVRDHLSIFQLPLFWICVGLLLFYAGSFMFMGVFNYLLTKESALAIQLNRIINKGLNYILYGCFSYAFLCSHRLGKSTLPS